jgi:hypothetical protein
VSEYVRVAVPPIPSDSSKGWRKAVTGVDTAEKGGFAVTGEWLQAGDTVEVPLGRLVLAVDKQVTGRRLGRYGMEDISAATVTVYRAKPDDLVPLWKRAFKQAKSALGATTLKKLQQLLDDQPVPEGGVTVVEEARRPNRRAGTCRWCHGQVAAERGHLVGRGENVEIEHWQACPALRATNGAVCNLCGVTVDAAQAHVVLPRDGTGTWVTRHHPDLQCTTQRLESWEELQVRERAADAQRREAAERQQELAAQRERERELAAQREQAERAAADAEQARLAGLAVNKTRRVIYDKRVGYDSRARMVVHTGTVEESTITWWTVGTYDVGGAWTGSDYDPDPETAKVYARREDAHKAYKALEFERRPAGARRSSRECDECGQFGAEHERYDSSGILGCVCGSCDSYPDFKLSFA